MLALAVALLVPTLPYRWIYLQTNLQVASNVDTAIALERRGKAAGYNGLVIADTKLQRLGSVPDAYRTNAARLLAACKADGMDLIPCVFPVGYAEGMLSNDPNLVEGQPVRNALFTVHAGEAQLTPTPGETFKNGGMEDASGDKLRAMGFQDSIGTSAFIDHQVVHSGSSSLRMTDPIVGMPQAGNCRIEQEIPVTPTANITFQLG